MAERGGGIGGARALGFSSPHTSLRRTATSPESVATRERVRTTATTKTSVWWGFMVERGGNHRRSSGFSSPRSSSRRTATSLESVARRERKRERTRGDGDGDGYGLVGFMAERGERDLGSFHLADILDHHQFDENPNSRYHSCLFTRSITMNSSSFASSLPQ